MCPQVIEKLVTENIDVRVEDNKYYGDIVCGFCKSDQKNCTISVSSKAVTGKKKSNVYWVLSNYLTHLQRFHPLQFVETLDEDLQVGNQKLLAFDECMELVDYKHLHPVATSTDNEDGDLCAQNKSDLAIYTTEKNQSGDSLIIVNNTSVIGDGSFDTNPIGVDKNESHDESFNVINIEKSIYLQISAQITKIVSLA